MMKKLKKILIAVCITVVVVYFLTMGLFAFSIIFTKAEP